MSLELFLKQQNEKMKELATAYSLASWKAATTGEEEWSKKTGEAGVAYSKYFSSSDLFQQVKEYLDAGVTDPVQKRELNLLYSDIVGNQLPEETLTELVSLSTELNSTFNTFRAEIKGEPVSENEIRKILGNSTDLTEREEAWHASKQIGAEVEEKLITLIKKRNEAARSLGYANHHQMAFELQELDRDFVFSTFKKLKETTDEPFRKVKQELDEELSERFNITVNDLRPWHYSDPFFQEAPNVKGLDIDPYYKGKDIEQITIDTFSAMGLDITHLIKNSDLYPRDKKNQHAFMSNIDHSGDIRVLCNIDESSYWMDTMLHEFGHAIYDDLVNPKLPFSLRKYSHILSTEAIAMYYGRMGKSPEWLQKFVEIDAETIERLTPKLERLLQRQMLISARWIMTFVFFERELYENPDQDLNALWWKIVNDVQFINPPNDTDYPHWAAKIHFCIAPVYYQNYLLGELTASQLDIYIKRNVSMDTYTPEVGSFLEKEYFYLGSSVDWITKIEKVTGEKLNPTYFVNQFAK
ncbi:M2 family metallopeptidase [Bacillus suaedae]|uniref:M3 family oligoendopeptidase n=1 Tax=Halalkalibacter suaedae TaxID=2822140 RepID=A0A940WQC5_9BACI|nr:M2 family metallopeptidase [Bacillus suaedae]MBP3950749.1 M3 family oligoendopeptidase [Bacillus suaedae]